MKKVIEKTFRELAAFDSPSKNESKVATYIRKRLINLGLKVKIDSFGNVIGFISGEGESLLLNAHMDGAPPGKGHIPVKVGNILKSDGSTNLRADDIAGMSIILEAANFIIKNRRLHPPLVLVFTAQEEIGLLGAKAVDLLRYGVKKGIVYDNAFKAGEVVQKGASYVSFDVVIQGKESHPGKNLSQGINAVKVLMETDIKVGKADAGKTRVNIGTITAGTARNVVPSNVEIKGEVRSFLQDNLLRERIDQIEKAFIVAAERNGAKVIFTKSPLATSYSIGKDEPLLRKYAHVLESRGSNLKMQNTFIASDANVFRKKGVKVFVVSTGVENEHSVDEIVDLSDLGQLTFDLISLIELSSK